MVINNDASDAEAQPASCAAYVGCSGLAGDCCPSAVGLTLNCCSSARIAKGFCNICALCASAAIAQLQLDTIEAERVQVILVENDAPDALPTYLLQISESSSAYSATAESLAVALLAAMEELTARLSSSDVELVSATLNTLSPPPPPPPPPPQTPPSPPPPSPVCADLFSYGHTMALSDDVLAASTVIEVATLVCQVQVGSRLLVGDGTPSAEQATVAGFGSIVLAEPLQNAHARGESVRLLAAPAPPPLPVGPISFEGSDVSAMGSTDALGAGAITAIVLSFVFLFLCLCLCCCCLARSEQRRQMLERQGDVRVYESTAEAKPTAVTPASPPAAQSVASVSARPGSINLGYGKRRWTQLPLDALAGFSSILLSQRSGSPDPRVPRPPPPTEAAAPRHHV